MENKMIENLKINTGKSLEQWIKIVHKTKLDKHKEIINYLKSEHDFTYGFANLVAHKARKSDAGSAASSDDLITTQYRKGKEDLKPIYDKLIKAIQKFGKDVEIAPKRAYVSLRRNKQFAIIQPSTKKRVDVGINCKDLEVTDRLEKPGSFNSMVSHRVRLENVKDVNKELIGWMKTAYEKA